jgi:hypothetical protein
MADGHNLTVFRKGEIVPIKVRAWLLWGGRLVTDCPGKQCASVFWTRICLVRLFQASSAVPCGLGQVVSSYNLDFAYSELGKQVVETSGKHILTTHASESTQYGHGTCPAMFIGNQMESRCFYPTTTQEICMRHACTFKIYIYIHCPFSVYIM